MPTMKPRQYRITKPTKMILYRAVGDIIPSSNKPLWKGCGVFGEGTYHRPDYREVTSFGDNGPAYGDDARCFLIITKFEATFGRLLHLTTDNTDGLVDAGILTFRSLEAKMLGCSKIHSEKLSRKASSQGFSAVLITGAEVEGGNQVLIPAGRKPVSRKLSFSILSRTKALASQLSTLTKIKVIKTRYGYAVRDIPIRNTKQADAILTRCLNGFRNSNRLGK
jgi:hypothetical protein